MGDFSKEITYIQIISVFCLAKSRNNVCKEGCLKKERYCIESLDCPKTVLNYLQRVSTDSSSNSPDKVQRVQGQVDELKGIMVRNIGNTLPPCRAVKVTGF